MDHINSEILEVPIQEQMVSCFPRRNVLTKVIVEIECRSIDDIGKGKISTFD